MADERVRFCLVGCGRICRKHAEALAGQVPGAELVAVADVKEDRAATVGSRYGVRSYTDAWEMLEKEPCDAVCILTESGNHARHCIEVARRFGRHVVVEKPMALSLDDADAMIAACDTAGVRLFVVKQNRYNLPVTKLREALEMGRFGRLVLGTVRVRWTRPQEYYDQDAWRGTWAMDGGVFANQAAHHVDLLCWMMGEVESVYAVGATRLVRIETEDTGVGVVRFRSGALGVLEATTATRPRDLEGSLSILGEGGSVEIGGFAMNEMRTWEFGEKLPGDDEVLDKFRCNPPDCYGFGHVEYLRRVVESLRTDAPALVDGLEGRKSLEVISALYESMETGREVALRYRPRSRRLGHGEVEG